MLIVSCILEGPSFPSKMQFYTTPFYCPLRELCLCVRIAVAASQPLYTSCMCVCVCFCQSERVWKNVLRKGKDSLIFSKVSSAQGVFHLFDEAGYSRDAAEVGRSGFRRWLFMPWEWYSLLRVVILLLASFACARKWRVVGLVGWIAQNDGAAAEMLLNCTLVTSSYWFFSFPTLSHPFFFFLDWSNVKCSCSKRGLSPVSDVCIVVDVNCVPAWVVLTASRAPHWPGDVGEIHRHL